MSKLDFSQIEMYDGKTFDTLLKQIHDNSNSKSTQIDALIKQLAGFIKNPDDASLLVPLLAEYIEVSVKNDDQLIKMAGIIQRFAKGAATTDDSNAGTLSEAEKEEIRKNAKDISKGKIIKMEAG
tara:strand:+ start:1774 stop:2148 length:375 start_codon:yes stop_codon:yes gene_type:complete